MSRFWSVAILCAAVIPMAGCCDEIEKELEDCKAALEDCDSGDSDDGVEFSLVINKDSFATFQPFNNQYRGQTGRPHRDGMFLQIGDFLDAKHYYTDIELHFADGTSKNYRRKDNLPVWIDIICGDTTQIPITVDMAKILTPEKDDPSTHYRRLHTDLKADVQIVPLTLWAPESGITLKTMAEHFGADATPEEQQGHGHVKFTFTTAKECLVRVLMDWPEEGNQAVPEIYPGDGNPRVTKMVVSEAGGPVRHGGPHQPVWN